MTPKTKIMILLFSLIIPYVAFAGYLGFTLGGNQFPLWFPYAALGYLAIAFAIFYFGRKKILAGAQILSAEQQAKQNLAGARSMRLMGYLWLLGPAVSLLSGGVRANPVWITVGGFAWAGFLSWASFRQAKKLESKARQTVQ